MKSAVSLNLEEMMNLGMHFGHKKEKSHASARSFIYCIKEGISIIDLEKTQKSLEEVKAVFDRMIKEGKTILFVATKPQAKDLVKAIAQSLEAPYVVEKWLGGTLTNFATVSATVKKMKELEEYLASEKALERTKRERSVMNNKLNRMKLVFEGIAKMDKMPDALFIIDTVKEKNALEEAIKVNIPVMAICDTNCNPKRIDYPIYANDDAKTSIVKVVEFITGLDSQKLAKETETTEEAPTDESESRSKSIGKVKKE